MTCSTVETVYKKKKLQNSQFHQFPPVFMVAIV